MTEDEIIEDYPNLYALLYDAEEVVVQWSIAEDEATEIHHFFDFENVRKETYRLFQENKSLQNMLKTFIEINRSTPEVKWLALDDLARTVEPLLGIKK